MIGLVLLVVLALAALALVMALARVLRRSEGLYSVIRDSAGRPIGVVELWPRRTGGEP